jgi:N-acetylglucosamine-6-phosphate deacetylase
MAFTSILPWWDLAWRCNRQGFILVTDAMAALGMPPGLYRLGEFTVRVNSLSARLDDGTLAGRSSPWMLPCAT